MVGSMSVTDDIMEELQALKKPAEIVPSTEDVNSRLDRIEHKLEAVLAAMAHVVMLTENVASQVEPILDDLAASPVGKVMKSMGVDLTRKGTNGKQLPS